MADTQSTATIDDRSKKLNLPLPHPANSGLVDVMRLREAFGILDEQTSVSAEEATNNYSSLTQEIDQAQTDITSLSQKIAVMREPVKTGLTLYASTTGANSRDGRSPDGAVQGWEGIVDVLRTIDMCGRVVTVSFAPGTYGSWEQNSYFGAHYNRTMQSIRLTSQNAESPAVLSGCVSFSGAENTPIVLGNIRIKNSLSSTNYYGKPCIVAYHGATVIIEGNVVLESGHAAMDLGSGSILTFARDSSGVGLGKLTLSGAFNYGIIATKAQVSAVNAAIHFDSPTFNTANMLSQYSSFMDLNGAKFTGTCTGKRYSVFANSTIATAGAGINFIPGTIAGSTDAASFGLYF